MTVPNLTKVHSTVLTSLLKSETMEEKRERER